MFQSVFFLCLLHLAVLEDSDYGYFIHSNATYESRDQNSVPTLSSVDGESLLVLCSNRDGTPANSVLKINGRSIGFIPEGGILLQVDEHMHSKVLMCENEQGNIAFAKINVHVKPLIVEVDPGRSRLVVYFICNPPPDATTAIWTVDGRNISYNQNDLIRMYQVNFPETIDGYKISNFQVYRVSLKLFEIPTDPQVVVRLSNPLGSVAFTFKVVTELGELSLDKRHEYHDHQRQHVNLRKSRRDWKNIEDFDYISDPYNSDPLDGNLKNELFIPIVVIAVFGSIMFVSSLTLLLSKVRTMGQQRRDPNQLFGHCNPSYL